MKRIAAAAVVLGAFALAAGAAQSSKGAPTSAKAETTNLTISVNVSDLQRSIDWYREALGFDVEYRLDEIGWAELTTPFGAVNVGLSQTEDQRAGGTVPTFGVVDIEACVRALGRLGYRGALAVEHEPQDRDPTEEIRAMRQQLEGWLP